MELDNYALKLNDTTVFVKGYSGSVRMRVETPNAPSCCSASRTVSELLRTTGPINRLLWIPKEKILFLWPRQQ